MTEQTFVEPMQSTNSHEVRPCLHFVRFRGNEYTRACKLFGKPDFIHPAWDQRARREIALYDIIVFAKGDETQPVVEHNAPDYIEEE